MAQGPSVFRKAPSNPFNDGILGRKIFKNLSLEDFVAILGISTAVSLFKESFGRCNVEPFDMGQVLKPLPRLGWAFDTYLEIVPWHQLSRLLTVMQDLTNSLFRQATAKVYQYAFDHNELAKCITDSLMLRQVEKDFLNVKSFPELWILLSTPVMAAESKISDGLLEQLSSVALPGSSSVVPRYGVPTSLLFSKDSPTLPSFTNEFLGEVLLLARGPLALVAKDKGLMASSGPLERQSSGYSVSDSFKTTLLLRALKKTKSLLGTELQVVRRLPKAKPWKSRPCKGGM